MIRRNLKCCKINDSCLWYIVIFITYMYVCSAAVSVVDCDAVLEWKKIVELAKKSTVRLPSPLSHTYTLIHSLTYLGLEFSIVYTLKNHGNLRTRLHYYDNIIMVYSCNLLVYVSC